MSKRVTATGLLLILYAGVAGAQTTVTTSGGTANSVPTFTGSSTIGNSPISTDSSGNAFIEGGIYPGGDVDVPSDQAYRYNGTPVILMLPYNNIFLGGAYNPSFTKEFIISNAVWGNLGIGTLALSAVTTGGGNLAVGIQSLQANTSGIGNTAVGGNTLAQTTTGQLNMALGANALNSNTTGNNNVAIGANALVYASPAGTGNIAIGNGAGAYASGSNGFYVGNVGQSAGNDATFSLLYGNFSGVGGSLTGQQLTVNGAFNVNGGASIGSTYVGTAAPANGAIIQGNVGIGLSAPTTPLEVSGEAKFDGTLRALQGITFSDGTSITSGNLSSSGSGQSSSYILANPTTNQTINQPVGTTLNLHGVLSEQFSNGNTFDGATLYGNSSLLFDISNNSSSNIMFNLPNDGVFGAVDAGYGTYNSTPTIFCVSTVNDTVGVAGTNACNTYDLFDISNRETFGNGYMHWFGDGATQFGWNAGISNPSSGVLSIDTTSDGNGAGTLKIGTIQFPNGTSLSSANSNPLGLAQGVASVITQSSGNIGIGKSNPAFPLDVQRFPASPGVIGGAIAINGMPILDATTIPISGNGTYVIAWGARIRGLYTLSIEGDNNTQTVHLLANAGQFDGGSTLQILDNHSYTGTIMTNFRFELADGGGSIYLLMDIVDSRKWNGDPDNVVNAEFEGGSGYSSNFSTAPPTSNRTVVGSTAWAVVEGSVGIGTPSPNARLEVNGNLKLTSGSGASVTYQDGTVQSTAWNGTLSGGDYAESIDVIGDRAEYEPGDVIAIDDSDSGKFVKTDQAYSRMVAGVFSTKPGLVGRRATVARIDKEAEVPMAMMGIVPVKVSTENGPIERGDLLVSAGTPGYAMKGTDRDRLIGAVLGKALAPLKSGTGVLEVLLSLQ